MIADNRGKPVWFPPLPGIHAATDFRAQTYHGKPVLTYWQGTSRRASASARSSPAAGRRSPAASAPNGPADLHEFLITPQNTALLITYPLVRTDLRTVGARAGAWPSTGDPGDRPRHRPRRVRVALPRQHRPAREFTGPEEERPVLPWDYAHTNGVFDRQRR